MEVASLVHALVWCRYLPPIIYFIIQRSLGVGTEGSGVEYEGKVAVARVHVMSKNTTGDPQGA